MILELIAQQRRHKPLAKDKQFAMQELAVVAGDQLAIVREFLQG